MLYACFVCLLRHEREDTLEEERMWLVRRFELRKRQYGLNVATKLLAHDTALTIHFG